jgi:hypothetical protein
MGLGRANGNQLPSSIFDAGAPPIPFLPPVSRQAPGGLPGLMASTGAIDPSNPDQPPPGGLPGMILDYLRNN